MRGCWSLLWPHPIPFMCFARWFWNFPPRTHPGAKRASSYFVLNTKQCCSMGPDLFGLRKSQLTNSRLDSSEEGQRAHSTGRTSAETSGRVLGPPRGSGWCPLPSGRPLCPDTAAREENGLWGGETRVTLGSSSNSGLLVRWWPWIPLGEGGLT